MARPMAAPHNAKRWWDPTDLTVGTGEASNSYLFQRRVRIQIEIVSRARCPGCGADGREPPLRTYGRRCDRCGSRLCERDAVDAIADVRCWLENEDLSLVPGGDFEKLLSLDVVERLKGKSLADAAAADFGDSEGQPTLVEDAVREALRDWARKFGGREARLPRLPGPERDRPPFAIRLLRRIPLLRGLGI